MNRFAPILFFFSILLPALSGCSREQVSAPSSSTNPSASTDLSSGGTSKLATQSEPLASLMAAVFGKNYRAASNDALADLPDPDDRKTINSYVLSPVAATVLANGETILVANAEVAGDDGRPTSGHASPGLLNVYVLSKDGGRWKVLRRHENIAALGSSGQIGEVVWTTLAPGKPGLGILHGGTWQGATITLLSLFDVGSDDLRNLTGESIKIHSDNDGACAPESDECWHVDGKWRFVAGKPDAQYDDLLVEFSGEKSQRPGDGQTAPESKPVSTTVHSTARYAFDGKRYRLTSGANIVPEF